MTDVVVMGGGILGACAALHIAEAGAGKVTLLERQANLGTQTTAAGAGFVAHWSSGLEAQLARYAQSFYQELQESDGTNIGLRQSGMLYPALSEAGMRLLQQRFKDVDSCAPGARLVDPDEACAIAPLLSKPALWGGLYQPAACQVSTVLAMAALQRRLRRAGVDIRSATLAVRALTHAGRVVAVETTHETIPTDIAVNAAGAAACALGHRNGVPVAAIGMLESRFLTEPVAVAGNSHPMMLFYERRLLYIREEFGRLLIGAVQDTMDDRARIDPLSPPDTACLSDHEIQPHVIFARQAAQVIPVLRSAVATQRSLGLPTWTPDGRHILGQTGALEGYYVIAGCNEQGVTHGPGLGRLLAQLIIQGKCEEDVSPYDVDRFEGMTLAEMQRAAERTYLSRVPETEELATSGKHGGHEGAGNSNGGRPSSPAPEGRCSPSCACGGLGQHEVVGVGNRAVGICCVLSSGPDPL